MWIRGSPIISLLRWSRLLTLSIRKKRFLTLAFRTLKVVLFLYDSIQWRVKDHFKVINGWEPIQRGFLGCPWYFSYSYRLRLFRRIVFFTCHALRVGICFAGHIFRHMKMESAVGWFATFSSSSSKKGPNHIEVNHMNSISLSLSIL